MRRNEDKKIVFSNQKVLTRKKLFKRKNDFHREHALLPFEEKIKILVKLQKLVNSVKKSSGIKRYIWKI